MVKLKEIEDIKKLNLVKKLIKEKITEPWLKDILYKKSFRASHLSRVLSQSEFFERYIWDNLSTDQQKKVIEELNLLLEKDLYIKLDTQVYSYLYNLVTLSYLLEEKTPGSINSKPLIDWMNKGFPNLAQPKNYETSLHAEFKRKIENAFSKESP